MPGPERPGAVLKNLALALGEGVLASVVRQKLMRVEIWDPYEIGAAMVSQQPVGSFSNLLFQTV